MEIVDTAQINSLPPVAAQTDFPVSPSEDAVFILNSSQLQDLITQAVQKAVQPLQDRVSTLENKSVSLEEENAALRLKLASQESIQEQDTNRICLDIAYDRQRLAKLERVEPQPLQRDRGEILRALLAANGGKMLAKQARQKMHLRKDLFSQLLKACVDFIELKPYHLDRRQMIIILKSELV